MKKIILFGLLFVLLSSFAIATDDDTTERFYFDDDNNVCEPASYDIDGRVVTIDVWSLLNPFERSIETKKVYGSETSCYVMGYLTNYWWIALVFLVFFAFFGRRFLR